MAPTRSPVEGAWRNAALLMAVFVIGTAPILVHHWWVGPAALDRDAAEPDAVGLAHGPVDIGFAQDMSLHHEQALTMARMAIVRGSPRVKLLAQGIVDQQLKEIGYLQGWLMLWGRPSVADAADMVWMKQAYARSPRRDPAYDQFIESCVKGEGMPGAATAEELASLEAMDASTARFDQVFLSLMIRHHQGAVVMARFAAEYAELEAVKGVARAMAAEQRQEMATMLTLLAIDR